MEDLFPGFAIGFVFGIEFEIEEVKSGLWIKVIMAIVAMLFQEGLELAARICVSLADQSGRKKKKRKTHL